ncbi:hypothetical protein B0H17DRAFT_1212473 [Mycena rosella]|uniref:Uncharacterized protein n=1 Tax=Mycena rosella TaxID=1033263 RepID=A0AAD7CS73_MYCRO|nr:hypothetical protein B0H17DRAFT_1212473 [Mycena rosella]
MPPIQRVRIRGSIFPYNTPCSPSTSLSTPSPPACPYPPLPFTAAVVAITLLLPPLARPPSTSSLRIPTAFIMNLPSSPLSLPRVASAVVLRDVSVATLQFMIILCISILSSFLFLPFPSPPSFTLVGAFPVCGLGVSVAIDGTLYPTEVYAASHSPGVPSSSRRSSAFHSHAHKPDTKT